MKGWFKSSFSGSGDNCVEVNLDSELVLVRDTKDREAEPQKYTRPEWRAFINGAKDGQFDL